MATNPENVHPRSGPWDGVDETGRGGRETLLEAFNVVHENGVTSRRPGRRIVATDAQGRRVNGIFQGTTPEGGHYVLTAHDPYPAETASNACVNRLDEQAGTLEDVSGVVPMSGIQGGGATAFASFLGRLIMGDPSGRLIFYDGERLAVLTAVDGQDVNLNAESYLSTPPTSTIITVWRNRLAVTGDPEAPSSIGLSEDNQNILSVPFDAPVGGPNVWPGSTQFALLTEDGDYPVALTVLNDRLIVVGRTSMSVVDEDQVAPVARILARNKGCIASRSVVNIGSHVIYLGDGQVYAFDGNTAESISGPVSRTMARYVDWNSASQAVAVNVRHASEYRIWLPVKGDEGNQLCLIFNYARRRWRIAAGWYLFDAERRREALTVGGVPTNRRPFDVTAAATCLLSDNREVLLTGDSEGNVWIEDAGLDDQGISFPAYFVPPALASGAEVETFRDVWLECLHDGSWLAVLGLFDGRPTDQEIVRLLDGEIVSSDPTNDLPFVEQRAILDGAYTWDDLATGPTDNVEVLGPAFRDLKFGLAQRARSMAVCVIMPGTPTSGTIDHAAGGVQELEIGTRPREGRRT